MYSPSALAQLLVVALVIAGVAIGVWIANSWQLEATASTILMTICAGVGAYAGYYSYGFRLDLSRKSHTLAITTVLLGIISLRRTITSLDEVQAVRLRNDGDGFPLIRLTLRDGRAFWSSQLRPKRTLQALECILPKERVQAQKQFREH